MLKLENMRPWEEVMLVLKRHWIVYFILSLYLLVWLVISWVLLLINDFQPFVYIVLVVFWMWFAMFLYIQWLNHELDMFIITNNRIIWVEQISFLNRNVTECNLWQVQEVNSLTKWLFANLLNYWTILIQTAWNSTNLKMDFAPESIKKQRMILNIVDDYRDSKHFYWEKKEEKS